MAPSVTYGKPDVDAVNALLNEAYAPWGEPEMFEWLCAQPDPLHHWTVYADGRPIGYESGVERELRTPDGASLRAVLRGNAAVSLDHTGEGVWSAMVDAIDERIETGGQELSVKYTNRDYKTFDVAKRDGYSYRSLPLYINTLSQTRAIEAHADGNIEVPDRLSGLAAAVAGPLELDLDDGTVDVADLVDIEETDSDRTLRVPMSDSTVTALAEAAAANTDSTAELAGRAIRSLADRKLPDVSVGGTDTAEDMPGTVYVRDTPDESRLAALCALYEAVTQEYDYYFRREERDLRHMLSHPELETTLWYQRDGDLVGFASLRWEPMASHDELWASDVVARDSQAREGLVQAIEQTADERGADVVAMLTTEEPNRRWARVEKQVVVWNPFNAPAAMHERLNDGDWRLGLYDVE